MEGESEFERDGVFHPTASNNLITLHILKDSDYNEYHPLIKREGGVQAAIREPAGGPLTRQSRERGEEMSARTEKRGAIRQDISSW